MVYVACEHTGCSKQVRAAGLCNKHYCISRYGYCQAHELLGDWYRADGKDGLCRSHRRMLHKCSEKDCEKHVDAQGKCKFHYMMYLHGPCINECSQPAQNHSGLCNGCINRNGAAPSKRNIGMQINNDVQHYCPFCKTIKTPQHFALRSKTGTLRQSMCIECKAQRDSKRHQNNRQEIFDVLSELCVQTSLNRCSKCWVELSIWHVDHIVPASLGGLSEISNYQILCPKCNLQKSNHESVDYRLQYA